MIIACREKDKRYFTQYQSFVVETRKKMLDVHNVDITNAIKALSHSMWPMQSGLLALILKWFVLNLDA